MSTQKNNSQTGELNSVEESRDSSASPARPQNGGLADVSLSGEEGVFENPPNADKTTKGVKDLLGNPKKAMVKISIPVMIALFFESIYNIVDTFWVSGLGAEALAAVGLAFPFFMALLAISTGIGVGAGSGISRAIGAKDKRKADKFATHAIVLAVAMSFIFWAAIPFVKPIFLLMGAEESLAAAATDYMVPFILFSVFIFLLNIGNSILNSEGNSRKTMFATIVGAVLNMILDPIFIYDWGLGLGIKGAAYASVISFGVSMLMVMYWLLIQKKTYVTIGFKKFRFEWPVIRDIIIVGIPATVSQLTMSVSTVLLNAIVLNVGGTDGAAVYSTGWRIISIGIMPLLGLGTGMTTMAGVSYGGHDIQKLKSVYRFGIKFGLILEAVVAVLVFVFAVPIAGIFATGDSAYLLPDIAYFLQIICLLFLFLPANILTSSMFQGLKLGTLSLMLTLIRVLVFEVPIAYILGIHLGMGLLGVWIGALLGDFLVMLISFALGALVIQKLGKLYPSPAVKPAS